MSLVPCEECGRDVSDKASWCPGCGAPVDPTAHLQKLSVGNRVQLVASRPAPYTRGSVNMHWEPEDDGLLGRTGTITEIAPDGTFKLDIDSRGGWFAPAWVVAVGGKRAMVVGFAPSVVLSTGDRVRLVTSRPAPYIRGSVNMRWEPEDDGLLGRTGTITEIAPDGTFKLDIDSRGGWFAPAWVVTTSPHLRSATARTTREPGSLLVRAMQPAGRFSRAEFATVYLGAMGITWVLAALLATIEGSGAYSGALMSAWVLIQAPLVVCAGIRRVHDLGRPGHFLLWAFVPVANILTVIYLLLAPGKPVGETQWG